MPIRNATTADIPAIVAMSERFYATTTYRTFAAFCPETVAELAHTLIDRGIVLLAENDAGEVIGMVGLFVAPFMFNRDRCAAYEVMWWVNPDAQGAGAGKALLAAVEPACRAAGCHAAQMVHLSTSPPQAAALYERLGYAHSETSYTKVL
ncbi:hypothetical protein ASD78_12300 [Lysobacter sp. Root667]|uniref:GNAT family N-acetyltransferase n=1 Tax=Lysobacter sp. Root667 TaxID=1736581 RepID=UPI0006FC6EDF|nr:GNAT family N-acetyltransferase [Lysobacter sp. Root667]KRA74267.1 hypothetical protein ASD78_12300 [Lysobacter sp. Root667]